MRPFKLPWSFGYREPAVKVACTKKKPTPPLHPLPIPPFEAQWRERQPKPTPQEKSWGAAFGRPRTKGRAAFGCPPLCGAIFLGGWVWQPLRHWGLQELLKM